MVEFLLRDQAFRHKPAYTAHREHLYVYPPASARPNDSETTTNEAGTTRWIEPQEVKLVTKKVFQDMNAVKVAFQQPIDLVNPESLKNWDLSSPMNDTISSFLQCSIVSTPVLVLRRTTIFVWTNGDSRSQTIEVLYVIRAALNPHPLLL